MTKKKPRIAIIGLKGLPAFGGAAAVGQNIIENLCNEFSFTVYSTESHSGNYNNKLIKIIVFKSLKNRNLNTLVYYLKSLFHCFFLSKYDLIHIHHSLTGIILPFLRIRYKVVGTIHGLVTFCPDQWTNSEKLIISFVDYLFIKSCNQVTCVSKYFSNYICQKYNKQITYIPNGSKKLNINLADNIKNDLSFGAGRIIPSKGLHLLLDALELLNSQLILHVYGDEKYLEDYYMRLKKHSYFKKVVFHGLIKSKEQLLFEISKSKIFIFPSNMEAMSMMLLEVASINIPVIASDIIQNKDIFNESEITFFKNNNCKNLSSVIEKSLNSFDELTTKAQLAYDKVHSEYNWNRISKCYASTYYKCLR